MSRCTLDCLGGSYQAEAGHGRERSEFLRKHNIDTYLIRPAVREEAEPPRTRRPSLDEMTTWSAELPFGDILGMNFVRSLSRKPFFPPHCSLEQGDADPPPSPPSRRSSPPSPTAR